MNKKRTSAMWAIKTILKLFFACGMVFLGIKQCVAGDYSAVVMIVGGLAFVLDIYAK